MDKVKSIGLSLFGLLVALIVLQFTLKVLKGVPVIGTIAGDAQSLSQTGSL